MTESARLRHGGAIRAQSSIDAAKDSFNFSRKSGYDSVPMSTQESASHLTWQQQLLQQSTPSDAATRERKSSKPSKKSKPKAAPEQSARSQLTWQQELWQQQRGPAFDHPENARDVETFGEGGGERRGGKRGQAKEKATAATSPARTTRKVSAAAPKKTQKSSEPAYAGPTFHNSPSAASLPAPSFTSRSNGDLAAGAFNANVNVGNGVSPANGTAHISDSPSHHDHPHTTPPRAHLSAAGAAANAPRPRGDTAASSEGKPTHAPENGQPTTNVTGIQTVDKLLANMMNSSLLSSRS